MADVRVTAKEIHDHCPTTISFQSGELPAGYYDALVKILAYEMSPFARKPRDADMNSDYIQATNLLHRLNDRPQAKEIDYTRPHTSHEECYYYHSENVYLRNRNGH